MAALGYPNSGGGLASSSETSQPQTPVGGATPYSGVAVPLPANFVYLTADEVLSPPTALLSVANRALTFVAPDGKRYRSDATSSAAGTSLVEIGAGGGGGGGGGFKVPQTEAAGRALTSADSGCWLKYTGAGAATFTIPQSGLTIGAAGALSGWQPPVIQRGIGAGAVTVQLENAAHTLNGVANGTKVLTVQGEYTQIIPESTTAFQAI